MWVSSLFTKLALWILLLLIFGWELPLLSYWLGPTLIWILCGISLTGCLVLNYTDIGRFFMEDKMVQHYLKYCFIILLAGVLSPLGFIIRTPSGKPERDFEVFTKSDEYCIDHILSLILPIKSKKEEEYLQNINKYLKAWSKAPYTSEYTVYSEVGIYYQPTLSMILKL